MAAADLNALSDPDEARPLAYRMDDEAFDILMSAIDLLGEKAEALCRRADAHDEGQRKS